MISGTHQLQVGLQPPGTASICLPYTQVIRVINHPSLVITWHTMGFDGGIMGYQVVPGRFRSRSFENLRPATRNQWPIGQFLRCRSNAALRSSISMVFIHVPAIKLYKTGQLRDDLPILYPVSQIHNPQPTHFFPRGAAISGQASATIPMLRALAANILLWKVFSFAVRFASGS